MLGMFPPIPTTLPLLSSFVPSRVPSLFSCHTYIHDFTDLYKKSGNQE